MGKAKTFIKFQRSLVQKAETVIDFETAGTSFYVFQHSLYFGEISCETNPTYFLKKLGFQHSRFLGFAMLVFLFCIAIPSGSVFSDIHSSLATIRDFWAPGGGSLVAPCGQKSCTLVLFWASWCPQVAKSLVP